MYCAQKRFYAASIPAVFAISKKSSVEKMCNKLDEFYYTPRLTKSHFAVFVLAGLLAIVCVRVCQSIKKYMNKKKRHKKL